MKGKGNMGKPVRAAGVAIVSILCAFTPCHVLAAGETGTIEVEVSLEGDGAYETVALTLRDRVVTLKGGEQHVFRKVSPGRYALTGEATVSSGSPQSVRRYLAVADVTVKPNQTAGAHLALRAVETVDGFCGGCHPSPGEPTEGGRIVRDLHPSGRALKAADLQQVEEYNKKIAASPGGGEALTFPIKLEEREVEENGRKVARMYYTCESCHTPHLKTKFANYCIASFRTGSDLCHACHY